MADMEWDFTGARERITAREWPADSPRWVALLAHGYGEHIGRYEYVADTLLRHGAVVYGPDHLGHGKSDGERVLVHDFEEVVADLHTVGEHARERHPGLPVVLIGHSMGGMIAARYAQRYGDSLACVVLSGPVLGTWAAVDTLLPLDEMPDAPIDPATLSRDPAVGEAYVADRLVWHGPFKKPTVQALADCIETINDAGTVQPPVLWVHGEDDQLVPYDGTATGWPKIAGAEAEDKVYPGARHEIFNETNQDEVLDDVLRFVHRHLPR
jgi:alpha-beta hydrolase superfamily lysophospholipase